MDQHALVRHGLALTLSAQFAGAVTIEAESVDAALDLASAAPELDIILLDFDTIGGGTEGRMSDVRRLAERVAPVPVVVMAAQEAAEDVLACIRAGAASYVPKSASAQLLTQAVGLVLAGDGYICVPRGAFAAFSAMALGGLTDGGSAETPVRVNRLTVRQREILHLLRSGSSNKEIARRLGVLEGTVKVHVRAVMQKLGVRNRTQVAVLAARWLDGEEPLEMDEAGETGERANGTGLQETRS